MVECKNCKNIYYCPYSYLGACTHGEQFEEADKLVRPINYNGTDCYTTTDLIVAVMDETAREIRDNLLDLDVDKIDKEQFAKYITKSFGLKEK